MTNWLTFIPIHAHGRYFHFIYMDIAWIFYFYIYFITNNDINTFNYQWGNFEISDPQSIGSCRDSHKLIHEWMRLPRLYKSTRDSRCVCQLNHWDGEQDANKKKKNLLDIFHTKLASTTHLAIVDQPGHNEMNGPQPYRLLFSSEPLSSTSGRGYLDATKWRRIRGVHLDSSIGNVETQKNYYTASNTKDDIHHAQL